MLNTAGNSSYYVYAQNKFGTISFQTDSIGPDDSVTFSTTTWIDANMNYPIEITEEVDSFNQFSPNTSTIDPLVSLDSGFLAANPGWTLETSDGFAVPEPCGLAILGAAVLPTFVLGRRRNRARV